MTPSITHLPPPASLSRGGAAELLAPGILEWRRLGWSRREWELRVGERRIGGLAVRGTFREHARLDGPSGDWEVRQGVWSGRVDLLHPAGTSVNYTPRLLGRDRIRCASGSRYEWGQPVWWRSDWDIMSESGFPIVRFRPRAKLRGNAYGIEIEPLGRRLPEIEGLVLLGVYLLARARSKAT